MRRLTPNCPSPITHPRNPDGKLDLDPPCNTRSNVPPPPLRPARRRIGDREARCDGGCSAECTRGGRDAVPCRSELYLPPLRASCEGGGGRWCRIPWGDQAVVRRRGVKIMHEADLGEIMQVARGRSGCGRHGDHACRLGEIGLWETWRSRKRYGGKRVAERH